MGGKLRLAALLALILAGVLWASGVLTHSTYRTSDSCLSYPRSAPRHEFGRDPLFGLFATRAAPVFRVPSVIPTGSILDDPAATGLNIRYVRQGGPDFRYHDAESCASADTGLGLLRFGSRTTAASAPRGCPSFYKKETLLPVATEPLAGQVRITCDDDPRVPNCTMQDKMPNGWTADITLPRTHLSEWRTASTDARTFFDATLTDCGEAG